MNMWQVVGRTGTSVVWDRYETHATKEEDTFEANRFTCPCVKEKSENE